MLIALVAKGIVEGPGSFNEEVCCKPHCSEPALRCSLDVAQVVIEVMFPPNAAAAAGAMT
jgi:hypothetical protein